MKMQHLTQTFTCLLILTSSASVWSDDKSMAGRHLQVLAMEVKANYMALNIFALFTQFLIGMQYYPAMNTIRNSTGHVIHANGTMEHMMNSISQLFHFT